MTVQPQSIIHAVHLVCVGGAEVLLSIVFIVLMLRVNLTGDILRPGDITPMIRFEIVELSANVQISPLLLEVKPGTPAPLVFVHVLLAYQIA